MSTVCRAITAHTRIQHPVCRAICVWKIIADFSLRVFLPLPHTINGWVNFQTSAIKIYFSSRLHRVGRSILSEWNGHVRNRLTRWRGKSNQPNENNNNIIVESNRTSAKLAPFILTFQFLNAAHATASSSSSEYFFFVVDITMSFGIRTQIHCRAARYQLLLSLLPNKFLFSSNCFAVRTDIRFTPHQSDSFPNWSIFEIDLFHRTLAFRLQLVLRNQRREKNRRKSTKNGSVSIDLHFE